MAKQTTKQPKILVGCPTWNGKAYILDEYIRAIKALDYPFYDILIIDNSQDETYASRIRSLGVTCERIEWHDGAKERVIRSRNLLRQRCLEGGYDYFFSVEQDVIVEPKTLNTLLSYRKDYVTTLVATRHVINGKAYSIPMVSVDFETRPGKLRYVMTKDFTAPLIQIKRAHLACTLLSRNILEKFSFRYDDEGFDDSCLCEDLLAAGFTLWCDTTLRPRHKPSSWKGIKR